MLCTYWDLWATLEKNLNRNNDGKPIYKLPSWEWRFLRSLSEFGYILLIPIVLAGSFLASKEWIIDGAKV